MENYKQKAPVFELLKKCTSKLDKEREAGWLLLIGQYKPLVYKISLQKFNEWNLRRKGITFSDVEKEVIDQIYLNIFENDCRVLRKFKAVHSEAAFLCYIRTITERVVNRLFKDYIVDASPLDSIQNMEDNIAPSQSRWQLFEVLVSALREMAGNLDRNVERDILIFNLYAMHDYKKEMIDQHPIFKKYGHRVYDNILNRSKDKLRKFGKHIFQE